MRSRPTQERIKEIKNYSVDAEVSIVEICELLLEIKALEKERNEAFAFLRTLPPEDALKLHNQEIEALKKCIEATELLIKERDQLLAQIEIWKISEKKWKEENQLLFMERDRLLDIIDEMDSDPDKTSNPPPDSL